MRNDTALQLDKTIPLFIEIPLTINTYDIDVAGHVNKINQLQGTKKYEYQEHGI
jgi:hypothetical protein